MKDYPFKKMPGLVNVEVEKGETILLPDGSLYNVEGKTHKRGGEKVFAPDGTKVFSNYVSLKPDVVEEITGMKKRMKPAELSKKYQTLEHLKDMKSKDSLTASTAALMFDKHKNMQEIIFEAQEQTKNKKKAGKEMKAPPEMQAAPEMQAGGMVDPSLFAGMQGFDTFDPVEYYKRNLGGNALPMSTGYSMQMPNPGRIPGLDNVTVSSYNPVAYDPFFTEGTYKNRGLQTGKNLENTVNYQEFISYPEKSMQLDRPMLQEFLRQQATILQRGEQANPDEFIEKFVVVGGQRIPLAKATADQINDPSATYLYHNKRTGKSDLIDGRQGNRGEGSTNQSQVPLVTNYYRDAEALSPLEKKKFSVTGGPRPLNEPSNPSNPDPNNPDVAQTYDDAVYDPGTPVGIDPETLYNGVLGARDVLGLASLRRNNPYYAFTNSDVSTTRFDPVNRLQNERAFNLAKEALDNSNVPEAVKQSQLAQLQANMAEGVNQVDITNYQNKLAHDNRNIEKVDASRVANTQNRAGANLQYLEQLSRSRYTMEQQKQELLDRMTERWRTRMQNQMNMSLINTMTPNFQFDPRTGARYVPGSAPVDYNMLSMYQLNPPS